MSKLSKSNMGRIFRVGLFILILLSVGIINSCEKDSLVVLTTTAVSGITRNSATSGGNILSDGGSAIRARGVCWSTSQNPTILNSRSFDGVGTGSFTSSITGLSTNSTYYVRAYATNRFGTSYGDQVSFSVSQNTSAPIATPSAATSINQTVATLNGTVNANKHNTTIIFEYGTTTSYGQTINATPNTVSGTANTRVSANVTGLSANTKYYFRVKAVSYGGTTYSTYMTFTTLSSTITTGKITGIIRDASTSDPLSGVTLNLFLSTISIGTFSSQDDGRYEISIQGNNGYKIIFSKQGYLNAEYQNINVIAGFSTVLEPVFLINQIYSGNGSMSGTIKNSLDGTGIPDVSLNLRRGINVISGNIITSTITGSTGTYIFNTIPAGNYTIEATNSNFNTVYFNVICLGDQDVANQDATMSPKLSTGETRIVLTWGESPSDLDSHFTGPLDDGTRFHMYYPFSEEYSPWPEIVKLDLDDTESYGPETTTLYKQITGIYRFSVHDYSNSDYTESYELSNSGAQVKVYKNSGLVATFNVPPNTGGTLWTVFEMSNNTISAINQMTYESDEYDIIKGGYINPDISLLRDLPKK